MRRHLDSSLGYIMGYVAILTWLLTAGSAFASPLDNLLSGPAGSNASAGNSGAGSSSPAANPPSAPTAVPFTQRLDIALTGAVGAVAGSCPGTNCDSSGDCDAISFQTPLVLGGAGGPSPGGSSGTSASSSGSGSTSSSAGAKSSAKSAIRTSGMSNIENLSVCMNVDVGVQTPNGSGGVCMPASGIGVVSGQSFTAAGSLCTDSNVGGSTYTLNASYGMENQAPPGAGSVIAAIDSNSGTATFLMRGTAGPGPIAVPGPASSGSGSGPRRE